MSKHTYRVKKSIRLAYSTVIFLLCSAGLAVAQSTAFTYQGKLVDNGNLANTSYDMQFKLFPASSGGTQVGTTLTFDGIGTNPPAVLVSNGIFAVTLDFGTCLPPSPNPPCPTCFNGSPRFLEIAIKPHGSGSYTPLSPRQPITATPYALKTTNLTFNGAFNDGTTIFTASNTFAGEGAGVNTTPEPDPFGFSGKLNAFFGAGAGQANTTGYENAFFGRASGNGNTTGSQNAFFGSLAGQFNDTGESNAFFGYLTGRGNTIGIGNAFFGAWAGQVNTTGNFNAFFGAVTGYRNTTGTGNTFIGYGADFDGSNTTGSNNTLLGAFSRVMSDISNATAIGYRAQVTQSDTLILGGINGVNNGTSVNVGIGTTTPLYRLTVVDPLSNGFRVQTNTPGGQVASFGGLGVFDIDKPGIVGGRFTVKENGNVGIGMPFLGVPAAKLQVIGDIRVGTSGTNGCVQNFSGGIIGGTCSSDARFKRAITPFPSLLSKIVQLRPVYFYWRSEQFPDRHFGQAQEAGLIAQEVEKVLPELVSTDEQGYKAVNYSKLPLLTLQAVKELKAENDSLKQQLTEQQSLNSLQQQQIQNQQQEIQAIKQLLCQSNPQADLCKAKSLK